MNHALPPDITTDPKEMHNEKQHDITAEHIQRKRLEFTDLIALLRIHQSPRTDTQK